MYTTGTPNQNESLSIVSGNIGGISVQCRLSGNSVKCFLRRYICNANWCDHSPRFQRSRGQSLLDLLKPERAYVGIIVIMCALRIYNMACTIVSRDALRLHVNIDNTFTGSIRDKRPNDNELNRCRNDDATTKDNGILRQCVHFCTLSALVCIVQLSGISASDSPLRYLQHKALHIRELNITLSYPYIMPAIKRQFNVIKLFEY